MCPLSHPSPSYQVHASSREKDRTTESGFKKSCPKVPIVNFGGYDFVPCFSHIIGPLVKHWMIVCVDERLDWTQSSVEGEDQWLGWRLSLSFWDPTTFHATGPFLLLLFFCFCWSFLWWSPKTLLACPLVFSSSSCYEIRASDRLEVLLFPFRPQSHHMITWINFPLVLSTTIKNDLSSFSHTILFLLIVSIPHCLRSSLYQFLSQVGFSFSCLLSNNGQIKPQIESLSFFFSQSRSLFLSRSIDREVSCYGQLDAIHKFGPFKCPAKVNRRLL